jgi:ribonuclease Z
MQSNIKYLSTSSGKSVILMINNKSYIFNIFEGFQRYCIEKNISLKFITTIFIPNVECIPSFCGIYLTLRDMNIKRLTLVCTKNIEAYIRKAYEFCPPNQLDINFVCDVYEDEYIKVSSRYIIQIKNTRGRFIIENVPKSIPKYLYKDLVNGKQIKVGDVFYKGSDFLEPEIKFNKIFILVDSIDEQVDDQCLVLCFRKIEYNLYSKICKNVWYLRINKYVAFVSQYNLLVGLNKISNDHHLPGPYLKSKLIPRTKLVKYLSSGDSFNYSKDIQNFKVSKERIIKYKSVRNEYCKNSVLFLGSGCAIPSKYRNVTGILVNIENKIFLFDCGEDTMYQIYRYYGSLKILDKIEMIFISHSHGDHSLGVINLIKKLKHTVKLVGPSVILQWVELFSDNFIPLCTDKAKTLQYSYNENSDFNRHILSYNYEYKVSFCGCVHSNDSCSVSLEYEGIKISYSGDTRPSLLFSKMAYHSNVLIHESTFDNENQDKALKTSHSTVKEANEIFKISESGVLLLTHFSQRYPKKFISDSSGIPCYDFYTYLIGRSIFKEKEISEYLETL